MERKRKRGEESDDILLRQKVCKNALTCPICFDTLHEVHVTICGHSFCHDCIKKCVTDTSECPVCKKNIGPQGYMPNYSLNDVLAGVKAIKPQTKESECVQDIIKSFNGVRREDLITIRAMLDQSIDEATKEIEDREREIHANFLGIVKSRKEKELDVVKQQLDIVSHDLTNITTTDTVTRSTEYKSKVTTQMLQVESNYDDLEEAYLSLASRMHDNDSDASIQTILSDVTKYSKFKDLSTLQYGDGPTGSSSIVSSLEFDKDGDLFAVAGVTKKVKIFDFHSVSSMEPQFNLIHYPVREIQCNAKISSVAYSPYLKHQLASTDYDGLLQVWDVHHNKCLHAFQEHEKRVWSVSYNGYDCNLLVTGGDDCSLKLWHLTLNHSIQSHITRANVCSVRFQPNNRYHLAYGSADHNIRLMDVRKFSEPLLTLQGHKKAVSYVQYLNDKELISASTDSELKLWNVETGTCRKTFKGHVNEKNFVGLTVTKDYISCGSENNSFYIYQKHVSKPILQYKFNMSRNILPAGQDQRVISDDSNDFVSSVCFRQRSSHVIAANSQGFIKVLEMVQ